MPDVTGINMDHYRRPGGFGGGDRSPFCGAPHPDNPDPEQEPDNFNFHFCRRLKRHDGDHAAFTHSISVPEEWPDERPHDV